MKCLMVAFAFVLPYHVLRTATAAGHRVHVLGNGPSRGLRWSRHCASYSRSGEAATGPAERLRDEIAACVGRHGIDIVIPSDDISTRLVAGLRGELPVPTSLIPDVATFDLLNDKARFTRFCAEHDVRAPQGWLFEDVAGLRAALAGGGVRLPITAKPTGRSAGIGVVHLREPADLAALDAIDYRPILVQRHISGETVGINVLCHDGEILAHATQRRDDDHFALFDNPDLLRNVERLVRATGYTGPANLDAVLEDGSGLAYIVECNPRFWYTIYMSMIVGINFVDLAMRGDRAPARVSPVVRLSLGDIARHPHRASALDWQMLRYHLSDPLPFAFQRRRVFDDRDICIDPAGISSDRPPAARSGGTGVPGAASVGNVRAA